MQVQYISRCHLQVKILNEEPLENPKAQIVSNSQSVAMEICTPSMHPIDINMFCNEQNWDKTCKKLASKMWHINKKF